MKSYFFALPVKDNKKLFFVYFNSGMKYDMSEVNYKIRWAETRFTNDYNWKLANGTSDSNKRFGG